MTIKSSFLFSFFLLAFSFNLLNAEEVNLSGKIQNQSGSPVENAEVLLLSNSDLNAKTDSEGKFSITGEITSVGHYKSRFNSSASVRGSNIQVVLGKSSPVTINIYNISGKKVYEFNSGLLNAGLNDFAIPRSRFGAGVYMIAINYEGKSEVFRYLSSAQITGLQKKVPEKSRANTAVLKKFALLAQTAIDTLLVSAEGYQSVRYPISSYNQSGIVIILEKTSHSRLDNIDKDCDDGVMPGTVSGGQNGWGSRYWDCCKPHCSWPDKTKHYAANCSIDGKTEVPCFKVVGDEHWTGLEGIKSGCDQDGEAFMCYCHVPFAVCKNLAYGFAAVPAGDDACGKCFQLQFDGGFRHGEPKAAHAMMKGKTMIVMASNIGHDVGGGQFDIMIPGGGLGAFRNGCARQWKVDVNNEALVGKGSGGLTSYCQEKVGWDADPEDIKDCVRSMCDNLFGKDPSLHDLWEGCIWYVDWMHAVDNPTFTYREVQCPQELTDLYYSSLHPRP